MSCGEKLYLLDFCILLIRIQLIMFVLYVLTFILSLSVKPLFLSSPKLMGCLFLALANFYVTVLWKLSWFDLPVEVSEVGHLHLRKSHHCIFFSIMHLDHVYVHAPAFLQILHKVVYTVQLFLECKCSSPSENAHRKSISALWCM